MCAKEGALVYLVYAYVRVLFESGTVVFCLFCTGREIDCRGSVEVDSVDRTAATRLSVPTDTQLFHPHLFGAVAGSTCVRFWGVCCGYAAGVKTFPSRFVLCGGRSLSYHRFRFYSCGIVYFVFRCVGSLVLHFVLLSWLFFGGALPGHELIHVGTIPTTEAETKKGELTYDEC